MNYKITKTIIVISLAAFSAACSHVSPKYSASATNVEEMRQIAKGGATKIGAGEFTAVEAGKKTIMCRGVGPVEAPDNKTFDQYVKGAVFDELKLAGVYDEKSPVKLNGKLDHIDFSSNIGAGSWQIKMTFSGDGVAPFVVEDSYEFSTNFVGDIACEQVAQALPAATQAFINKLIQQPGFKMMLNKNMSSN